jgi:hypothetical protein
MELLILVALLAGLGYYAFKHYAGAAKLAAAKAELAVIEAHVKGEYSIVKFELTPEAAKTQAFVLSMVSKLKAKLGVK